MTIKWQRTYFISSLVVFGILALSESSWAYQALGGGNQTPGHAKTAAGDKNAKEIYDVIQVGEDISVIFSSEKAGLQKKYNEEYDKASKQYKDAKKDKNNHDANMKKPDKLKDYTIKVLKAKIKNKEDAQKFADDKIKERDKGEKKSTDESKKW